MARPAKESVYEEIRKVGKKGKGLTTKSKIPYPKELLKEDKIQKINSGKKCIFVRRLDIEPPPEPSEIPLFAEFVETLQKIHLRKTRRYREEVRILPLLEELTLEMDISRKVAEKWILELPEILIGIVDLRSFSGGAGMKLESGAEVPRIYLERGIVGL
jgi:hypothetical protein